MALPFIRIYIGDLKKDTDLLTPAAFGGYMRLMLFAMHEAKTRGEVNFTLPQLCRIFGAATLPEAEAILREIVDPEFNVVDYAEADNKHFIRNRRMVRETKVSQARSEAGKKGAEVTNGKFKKVAEDLPQQNGGAGEISSNEIYNEELVAANPSTKNQQNCNNNNSNNSINSNDPNVEEEGVKGEEETIRQTGATIDKGTAVLIVPEMRAVFTKLRPTYQFDPVKDFGPLRLIGEAIGKGEGVSAYELAGIDRIKQTFEAIIRFTLTHKLYKSFQLSQIEKYFQTICENMRDQNNPGSTAGTQIPNNPGPKPSVVAGNMQTAQGAANLIRNKYANQGANA